MKTLFFPFLVFFFLILTSCHKDLGNYTYTEINEVSVVGIDSSYNILAGDRLVINPSLTYLTNADTSLFEYDWVYSGTTIAQSNRDSILQTGLSFDHVLGLEAGSYILYFRATEIATGITYNTFFTVAIGALGYEGWLLLSDVNGESRLDMLGLSADIFVPQIDILSAMGSNVQLQGTPVGLDLSIHPENSQIYVITSEEGYHLSPGTYLTGADGYDAPFSVLIPSNVGRDISDTKSYMGFYTDYFYSNGAVYSRNYQWTNGLIYGTIGPINTDATGRRFSVAPFVAATGSYIQPKGMMFNDDTKTMYRFEGTSTLVTSYPVIVEGIDIQNYDLVYMDYSNYNGGNIFAVFKEIDGLNYQLAVFNMDGVLFFVGDLDGPDIANAVHFTASPDWGYLLYATDNDIYEFDLGTQETNLMHTYAGETISYFSFPNFLAYQYPPFFVGGDRYLTYNRQLIVCTYDEANPTTSGKFQRYDVPTLNQPFILLEAYERFGKIVSVVYNEK